MDAKDLSYFESHSSRNVFRRHLQDSNLKQFENDSIRAISALELPHIDRSRQYLLTSRDEDALENLLFPEQILADVCQTNWSHVPNLDHPYLHLMIPRVRMQTLFSHAHIKRFKAGTVLNIQNRTGCPLIVLLTGQCQGYFSTVGVELILPDHLQPSDYERTFGKEQCLLGPGDIFGCEMFCHRNSTSMTLITKGNVVALTIDEKVLSVLSQQWKRTESFSMSDCRRLLEINSSAATTMITDILQMQCTLGISGLFAKKRKISLKQDLSGCLLAEIPAGVDVIKFLSESFKTATDVFLPLKSQDCHISSQHQVGAFVVLSGSFAAFNQRSFHSPFDEFAKNVKGLSVLGPSSMFELNDPFFKIRCSSDDELLIISREQSDILLIPQDQIARMAFQSWFSNSDSIDVEKCTSAARTLIAIDTAGKHAKTTSTCTVGEIMSLCSSEARKSHLETSEEDHMLNILIHRDCSDVVENVLKSQFSSLLVLNSEHFKALTCCVSVLIRMPIAVHQSHARKIFHNVISDSDIQSCCIIIVRGSCVCQSTMSAKNSGMQNTFAADLFSSMSSVPSDDKLKKLESQDLFFVESLSSLQMLSPDFLAITLPICDIDLWADDVMPMWTFAKQTLIVPLSSSLASYYSRKDFLVSDIMLPKKDAIPSENKKTKSHKIESQSKKSFATSTHSSKLKRFSTTNADFFESLRSKNEKSSRLRLRRSLRTSEKLEDMLKQILDDDAGILNHWMRVDLNSTGIASMSELHNWLIIQFPQYFKTSKVILLSFRDTLKHFRIISQGCIELPHFSYFIRKLIDYLPAELVFDAIDVNCDKKFSLSEFTLGIKKVGLELSEIEFGSDFQEIIDASGTDATFDRFCRWFLRRDLQQLLFSQDIKSVPNRSDASSSIKASAVASSSNSMMMEDFEVEMCSVLHLHPQCKLIPDRVALDLPFEILKVSKGSVVLQGSSIPALRHIMFVIEGVVASVQSESSCNPICLSAGSSFNQSVSSPWHRHRTSKMFYYGSASIGDSNFFHGVGDGLEYMAVTDVVLLVLRWQHVELQWQQTMLMDLQSQHAASEYFLWSKPPVFRTNYQQMKLLSSVLSRQFEATIDKAVLALFTCHSQLCATDSVSAESTDNITVRSSETMGRSRLPSVSAPFTSFTNARDEGMLTVTFQLQSSECAVTDSENADVLQNEGGSASQIYPSAIAFIITGPAHICIKGVGLSVLSDSKQIVEDSIHRRQTTIDPRRDSKKTKSWHLLAGQCAVVTSEQLASVCRGRINISRETNLSSMSCHVDKLNLLQYPVISSSFVRESTLGSLASIDSEVRIALLDMCCAIFLEHVSSCYSNHKCFRTNSISNLVLSHAGTRTLKYYMGETIWKIGQEGIFVVLKGLLRVMFAFGELQLIPDSRKSGMSVSNHFVEILCLGQMSIFGDISGSVSNDVNGQVFVDCADAECELLYFPVSAASFLSPQSQTDLKSLFHSRSQIIKQSMLTQKDILHSVGFKKEKMHIMQLAESESNRLQFMREPNKYSQIQPGNDAPNSMAEISALRHFASSKNSLIKNSCFQSLNENVKDCSAHMASFYKVAGRQSNVDSILEVEARSFEENMKSLNVLPLNSAPKLKRMLKKEQQSQSTVKSFSAGTTPSEIMFDSVIAPIVPIKQISDAQRRINKKILLLKSDDSVMEAFKNRVTLLLARMPGKGDMETKNKDVSSYATPEAKILRIQANSAIMKQRYEHAKRNAFLLESSFKESTALKLEEDNIRIQNNLLIAENKLRQKYLADFQLEIFPVFAIVSRFHWFAKILLNEVPKVRHKSRCIVHIQRWVRIVQMHHRMKKRKWVVQTFRRAFRRFKMMYSLWQSTFALKLLIKFMREMKKSRQVTFVIRSYMMKVKQIQSWWRIIRFPYFSRRQIFRLLTRKIEAAMDAYKDETVLKQGSKIKQTASKATKSKDKKVQKKKSSRPDTRENVREHVDKISSCVAMHIQLVGETGKSPVPLSEDEILRFFRLWMRELIPKHQEALKRYEEDVKRYEEAIRRQHFKKDAQNLFNASKIKQEVGNEMSASGVLNPPLRPSMKLIPSWDSVLCTIEARLLTEFMKLEKWFCESSTRTLLLEHSTKNWAVMLTMCCQVLKADAIKRRFELLAEQGEAWFMGKRLLPGP